MTRFRKLHSEVDRCLQSLVVQTRGEVRILPLPSPGSPTVLTSGCSWQRDHSPASGMARPQGYRACLTLSGFAASPGNFHISQEPSKGSTRLRHLRVPFFNQYPILSSLSVSVSLPLSFLKAWSSTAPKPISQCLWTAPESVGILCTAYRAGNDGASSFLGLRGPAFSLGSLQEAPSSSGLPQQQKDELQTENQQETRFSTWVTSH